MDNQTPNNAAKNVKTPEQKAKEKKVVQERRAAKNTLFTFSESDAFKSLPKDVKDAIVRIAKPKSGGGRTAGPSALSVLFPAVGATKTELDIFKDTKKGRSEMKKLVRETLKSAAPADRLWVEFDETKETWKLVKIGGEAPANWTGFDLSSAKK